MSDSARRSAVPWLVAIGGYAALTLIFTWPLAAHLSALLPHDLGDPILNTWILWWNAHTVPLTARWWNAPMFWPLQGTLGLSEHLLGLSLVATPIQWLGADPVTAYNIVFLLSFPLCALAAHALAFELTGRHDAAAVAALVFGFNPYRTAQIAHVQMMWAFWMPLALLALHRYARGGRWPWLALFGAMWLGQALSNGYYLIFFPVLLVCWIAWFLLSRGELARAGTVTAAWAAASLPLLPIAINYQQIHERVALHRTLGEIRGFSADILAFGVTSPWVWAWTSLSHVHRAEQQLFPGVTAVGLILVASGASVWRSRALRSPHPWLPVACVAVACALAGLGVMATLVGPWQLKLAGMTLLSVSTFSKPLTVAIWFGVVAVIVGAHFRRALADRSAFAFYAGAAVLMYVCSLGPEPSFASTVFWYKPPYAWLMQLPGFSTMRVPARFAMLGELCLAIAAAIAFARLATRVPRRCVAIVAAFAICGVLADSWVHGLPLPPIPERLASLETGPEAGAVVELPLGDVLADLAAIYRSIYHRRALVNGYSGFIPAYYTVLRVALEDGEVDALDALAAAGPLTVVVDTRRDDRQWKQLGVYAAGTPVDGGQGRRLYALPQAGGDEREPSGERLRIQSATASSPAFELSTLTDGDPISHWDSGSPQRGHEWIVLDLGTPRRPEGLLLGIGPYFAGYPRRLAIDGSPDGERWTTLFEGRSAARAVAAARRDPREVAFTFAFAPMEARWIRLRQLGYADEAHWTISELAVLGR